MSRLIEVKETQQINQRAFIQSNFLFVPENFEKNF